MRRTTAFEWAVFGLVGLLVGLALLGPLLAPAGIEAGDIRKALQAPSAQHWLGTDEQGRDVLWRVVIGARTTLLAALIVVTTYSSLGIALALVATIGPRWLDEALMRMADIGLSLPGILVALGFAAALGPSLQSAVIAMGITGWPITLRLLRGTMRETMAQPFVQGAEVLGVSRARLMARHVLPNSLDVLYVKWAGDIGNTVLVLAGLSFIGVGAQPPSAEWGAMIAQTKGYISSAWWAVVAPGVAIALTSVGFGLLGEILQVRRNPALRDG